MNIVCRTCTASFKCEFWGECGKNYCHPTVHSHESVKRSLRRTRFDEWNGEMKLMEGLAEIEREAMPVD